MSKKGITPKQPCATLKQLCVGTQNNKGTEGHRAAQKTLTAKSDNVM